MTDRGIRAGVRRLFRLPLRTPASIGRDADAELDTFLEERIASLVRRGLSPEDARAEALHRLGAPLGEVRRALRHSARRREGRHRLRDAADAVRQDAHVAVRQFARAPGFTAIAVLTLALGIGANTAIFSVVHRLLLAPLPYGDGTRIVIPVQDGDGGEPQSVTAPVIQAWLAGTHTIETIAAAEPSLFSVGGDGIVDSIPNAFMTANYLRTLGVTPVRGRAFTPEEERARTPTVAMIGHASWTRDHGGRDDVLGTIVRVRGQPLTIVGVVPPGLTIPLGPRDAPDLWLPRGLEQILRNRAPFVFARLRDGVPASAASSELAVIARRVPDPGGARPPVRAMRLQDFLDPREARAVQVLFAAVAALLLIACANVANLLLARAWTRRREFAVRVALGAGRARLARQVMTESVILALAGGALGVGVAALTIRVIIALRPPSLEHLADVRIESAMLLWTLGLSLLTGMLFGCAPALFAGARRVGQVLRGETRAGTGGVASRRFRSALIVSEIAIALVLLVGAGLLVRSFVELHRLRLGFEPRGLVQVDVLVSGLWDSGRHRSVRAAILDTLRATPGLTMATVGSMPGGGGPANDLEAERDGDARRTRASDVGQSFIAPEFFRVARVALLEGRLPDSSGSTAAWNAGNDFGLSGEVVVSRALARRLWPDGRAVGGRVRVAPGEGAAGGRWSTVVGVADDIHLPGMADDLVSQQRLYSLLPPTYPIVPFLVRAAGSGEVAAPAIERAMKAVDRRIFVRPARSGEATLRDRLAPSRFAMALLTAFAVVALVLSAVGLYGIIAYGVSQRTREIGVRVALGAGPGAVTGLVIGGGVRLAVAGVAIGAVVAALTTRVLGQMLYGVRALDPVTFVAIVVLVAAIALLAAWVPARRALRIDPMEALRAD